MASACSTSTATAGSTSTASRAGPFPPAASAPSGDRLFRNRGDGTFEDVTDAAGLAAMAGGYGHGVAVGDYDNDGHPDLFVTRWRRLRPLSQPGRRHLRGRRPQRPGWPATATGPLRRPSPTSTATATSTSTSATTWPGTPSNPTLCADPRSHGYALLLPPRLRLAARPRLPQRRRPVRRRDRRGGNRRPRRPGPGRRGRRPRRRRPDRPLRGQRHVGQLPVPQPGGFRFEEIGHLRRASPATRRAATRRAWASPAATSTATAGSTWP